MEVHVLAGRDLSPLFDSVAAVRAPRDARRWPVAAVRGCALARKFGATRKHFGDPLPPGPP
eukprot:1949671-Pyramimonas_sp.AAC.1